MIPQVAPKYSSATNTILIATSNLGADIIQRTLRERGERAAVAADSAALEREVMEVVRQHFRPEFINRIDEIIVFEALDREQIRDIVRLQLERLKRTAHGQGVQLEIDDSAVEHFASAGYRPEYGARELRRLIRYELETQLARAMLVGELQEGDTVEVRWDPAKTDVTLEPRPRAADKLAEPGQASPPTPTPASARQTDSKAERRRRPTA